ncbi:hypothetical protein KI387_006536, partial [Taxus chinensis]
LKRSGRSCRRRWVNYLSPNLKRTKFTTDEERLIIELHARWGNRWSRIAQSLPGRTDGSIQNYWRTHIKNKNHLQENVSGIQYWSNVNFHRLIGSSSIPYSFQEPAGLKRNDEQTSTSLPKQSIQDGQVTHKNDIKEENPDTSNGGKSEESGEGHSIDFPYSFSVEYLNAMTVSELYSDGKADCSLYNMVSPVVFPDNALYSDELWNMDEG